MEDYKGKKKTKNKELWNLVCVHCLSPGKTGSPKNGSGSFTGTFIVISGGISEEF